MPFLDVFRTATFRLAFAYLCLFAVSVMLLLGFIYWRTAGFMATQSDETIRAEVKGLAEQYKRRGILWPASDHRGAQRRGQASAASILLVAPTARRSPAISRTGRPTRAATAKDLDQFQLRARRPRTTRRCARAAPFESMLPSGFKLLVGRDIKEVNAAKARSATTLLWALAHHRLLRRHRRRLDQPQRHAAPRASSTAPAARSCPAT